MSGWQTKVMNIFVNFLPVCIFHIWNEHSGVDKKKARTPVECTYLSTGKWVLPITIFQDHSCGFCLDNRVGMRICPVSAIFVTANGWEVNRAGGNCSHRHSTLSGLGSLSLVSHHITPHPESLGQKSTSICQAAVKKHQPTNSTSFSFIKAHVVTGQ